MKSLVGSEFLEIDCDIFRMSCDSSWKHLKGRVNTRVLLTEDESRHGKVETGISLLKLEKLFTNNGVPIATLNMYGMKNDALRFHIAKAILRSSAYFGAGKYMLRLWICRGASQECISWLTELLDCEIRYRLHAYLLCGDSRKKLEDECTHWSKVLERKGNLKSSVSRTF